jgi:hypothetical protein
LAHASPAQDALARVSYAHAASHPVPTTVEIAKEVAKPKSFRLRFAFTDL